MSDLPPHVGRQVDRETGYALVCNATPGQDPDTGTLCGQPATHHFRWREIDTENGFACAEHVAFARSFAPWDEHSVEGSACGMPGSFWVSGDPSRCVMDVLDEEPAMSGAARVEVPA